MPQAASRLCFQLTLLFLITSLISACGGSGDGGSSNTSYSLTAKLADSDIAPSDSTTITITASTAPGKTITITPAEIDSDDLFSFSGNASDDTSCTIAATETKCIITVTASSSVTTTTQGDISLTPDDGSSLPDQTLTVSITGYTLSDSINATEISASGTATISITASNEPSTAVTITPSASDPSLLTFSGDNGETTCTIGTSQTVCTIDATAADPVTSTENVTISLSASDGSILDGFPLTITSNTYTLTADSASHLISAGDSTDITVTATGTLTSSIIVTPSESSDDSDNLFAFSYPDGDSACTLTTDDMSCTIIATATDDITDTETGSIILTPNDGSTLPDIDVAVLISLDYILTASLEESSLTPGGITTLTLSSAGVMPSSDVTITAFESNSDPEDLFNFGTQDDNTDASSASCEIKVGDSSCSVYVQTKDSITAGVSGEISFQTSDGQTIDDITLTVYTLSDAINATDIGAGSDATITITASSALTEAISITPSSSGDTENILTFSGNNGTGCTIQAYETDCTITATTSSALTSTENVTISLTSSDGSTLDSLPLTINTNSYTLTADISSQLISEGASTTITITASGTLTSNTIKVTPTVTDADIDDLFTFTYANQDTSSATSCTLSANNMGCTITATAINHLDDSVTATIILTPSDSSSLPSFVVTVLNKVTYLISGEVTDNSIAPGGVTQLTLYSAGIPVDESITITTNANELFTFGTSSSSTGNDTASCTISSNSGSVEEAVCEKPIYVQAKSSITDGETGAISFTASDSQTIDDVSLTVYTISGELGSTSLAPGDETVLTLTATFLPGDNVTISVEEDDGNSLLTFKGDDDTDFNETADCELTTSSSTCSVLVKANDDITDNYNDVTISMTPSDEQNIDDVSLSISSKTGTELTPSMSAMTFIASEIITISVNADSVLTSDVTIEITDNGSDSGTLLTLSADSTGTSTCTTTSTCSCTIAASSSSCSLTATATSTSPDTSSDGNLGFTITDPSSSDDYLTSTTLNYTLASNSAYNLTPTIRPAQIKSGGTATITLFANTVLSEDIYTSIKDNSQLFSTISTCGITAGSNSCSVTATANTNSDTSSKTGNLSFAIDSDQYDDVVPDATFSPQIIDYQIFPESYSVSLTPSISVNGTATTDYSFASGDHITVTISADSNVSEETTVVASDFNDTEVSGIVRSINGYLDFINSNQCHIPVGDNQCSIEALINYMYETDTYTYSLFYPILSLSTNNSFATLKTTSFTYEVSPPTATTLNAWLSPNPMKIGEKGMLFVKNNQSIADGITIQIRNAGDITSLDFNNVTSCIISTATDSCGISITAKTETNGESLTLDVTGGDYTLDPINFSVESDAYSGLVRGWPSYLAMGAITDLDNTITLPNLEASPVNSIYKYVGTGQPGDQNTYVTFPMYTYETIEQTFQLNPSYAESSGLPNNSPNVLPTMVVYTANSSYDSAQDDLTSTPMMNYFTKLIMVAQMLERSGGGSIILNPDLTGWLQQDSANLQAAQEQINAGNSYSVQDALISAVTYVVSYHDYTSSCLAGYELTPYQLFTVMLDNPLSCDSNYGVSQTVWGAGGSQSSLGTGGWVNAVITTPPTFDVITNTNAAINYNLYTSDNTSGTTFDNTLDDWFQATNWIIETFAPNVSYGWMENLWATNSANFIHTTDKIDSTAKEVGEFLNGTATSSVNAYAGTYMPDFIVFDRFESDAFMGYAYGQGYGFNARDWYNYINFVGEVADTLTVPAIIWQIPGAHLPRNNDIDTRGNYSGLDNYAFNVSAEGASNFFFSESQGGTLAVDFTQLMGTLADDTFILTTAYGYPDSATVSDYLQMQPDGSTDSTYLWHDSYLSTMAEKNIMAILWGGGGSATKGYTTNVAPLYLWSSENTPPQENQDNDNGWLATRIRSYFANPETLSSNESSD